MANLDLPIIYPIHQERVLKIETESAILPAWARVFFENRIMSLMQEVNGLRRALGQNPKRCPHCGEELK